MNYVIPKIKFCTNCNASYVVNPQSKIYHESCPSRFKKQKEYHKLYKLKKRKKSRKKNG